MILFASDYDGTLKRNYTVEAGDLELIEKFRSSGGKFGIVTGRSIDMLRGELTEFGIKTDFVIGNNGGVCADSDLRPVQCRHIDTDSAMELIHAYKGRPDVSLGLSDGVRYARINDIRFPPNAKDAPRHVVSHPKETSLKEILDGGFVNSFFMRTADSEKTFLLWQRLKKDFAGRIDFHYNNGTIDATAAGVSKATGVTFMKDHFNADRVCTMGDGLNDISMIQEFHGFSLHSAEPEVRRLAVRLFDSVGQCLEYITEPLSQHFC